MARGELLNPLPPPVGEPPVVEALLMRDTDSMVGLTCYHFFLCLRGLRVYAFTAAAQRCGRPPSLATTPSA